MIAKKALLLIVFLSGLLFCKCSSPTLKDLYDIEKYLEERPDSALRQLAVMDSITVSSGRKGAMYDFLTSYAMFKSYINEEDDSRISRAIVFFRDKKDSERLMKSLYLKGYTLFTTGDYIKAIKALSEGEELAEERGDYYFAGLCCRELAQTFQATFSAKDFLFYSQKALECFQKGNREVHARYVLLLVGSAFYMNDRLSEAEKTYKTLISLAEGNVDSGLLAEARRNYAFLLVDLNKPKEAIDQFQQVSNSLSSQLGSYGTAYLARAYINLGEDKIASALFARADSLVTTAKDQYSVDYQKYSAALFQGDTTKAFLALQGMKDYTTSKRFLEISGIAVSAQKEFYQERERIVSLENKLTKQKLISSILFFFLLLFLVCFVFFAILRKQRQKKTLLQKEKEQLVNQISALSAEHSEHLKQSSETGMRFFNAITQIYWQNQPHKVVPELQRILEGLVSDEKAIGQLMASLNETRRNLMVRLNTQVPALNKKELLLYCYLASHLEHNTICSILDKTPGAVNAQIYRLRKKIERSGAPDTSEFLEVIS